MSCSNSDLWVVCIRRTKDEPKFTQHEYDLLQEFGSHFWKFRHFWYAPNMDQLTKREQDIVRLLASGLSPKQIAKELKMSRRTVETHLTNARSKLRVNSSVELLLAVLPRFDEASS